MENLITRHRNVSILVAVLFAQVLGLAVQVKRSSNNPEDTRLIRIWAVSAVTPFEKAVVWMQQGTGGIWHNYVYLRGVRAENRDLKQEIERMRVEQVRLSEDAEQARRLQLLLGFKEKFISKTVAAQVIGSSGSEQSRSVYIDKGSKDGIEPDQAVITADGIVGKVLHVYNSTSLVLLINDQTSGVGVILEKSRLQGVLRGTPVGGVVVEKVMNDETVQPGEHVLTSGGDQIFPKGLDVGAVTQVNPGPDSFLNIRLKPAANLSKLEEVLVVTQVQTKLPTLAETGRPVRAVDILAQRLPSVPDKSAADTKNPTGTLAKTQGAVGPGVTPKPAGTASVPIKPGNGVAGAANKPANATAAVPNKNALNQQPRTPNSAPVATSSQGMPKAASGSGVTRPANGSAPKAATIAPNRLKPASATPVSPNDVKPAVVQKPAAVPKPAAPANQPSDKSANPAPEQSKPEPAPVEDKPQ